MSSRTPHLGPRLRRRLGAALLLGAATAFAVSTVAAFKASLVDFHAHPVSLSDADLWLVVYEGRAATAVNWRIESGGFKYEGAWDPGPLPPEVPVWTRLADRGAVHANDPITVLGFGWPLRAFRAELQTQRFVQSAADFHADKPEPPGGEVFEVRGGLGLKDRRPSNPDDARDGHVIIPLTPIWGGLAADAALFGALWALPLAGPALLRWNAYRKLGRCPTCGYDLRGIAPGAPCPECGAARPPTSPSTPRSTPASPPSAS